MAKLSLTPTTKSVDQFIAAAGETSGDYPWDDPKVRDDVMKLVSLRLSEPYIIKLQWISEQTSIPQQKLLREVLLPWIDEEVKRLAAK